VQAAQEHVDADEGEGGNEQSDDCPPCENFAAPELNMISYIGAFVVVCGAILSAIGHKLLSQSK